jgi:undecaprenyl-diphosphatase
MEILEYLFLGLVQGLGEFLPISSTAHLILVPYFFGWQDPGLAFDVALHLGTLIAVVSFFWKDWLNIFKLALENKSKIQFDQKNDFNEKTLWLLVLATLPGILAGYFLEARAETIFRSPLIIAATLFSLGLVLYLADKYLQHKKSIKQINWKDVLVIGFSQAVAIIPGVSRSGATITAGLFLGLSRQSAARFSFLLSTPIILGATIFKLPELFQSGINWAIILGVLVSAISGYLAIKYLLLFIEKIGYGIFFWYRTLLALAIVLFQIF